MKIRIDDDYDKNDLDKFDIASDNVNHSNDKSKDNIVQGDIIETTFQEVDTERYDYNYADDYKEYYSSCEEDESSEGDIGVLGEIKVMSRLANKNKTLISSAKINLYILNGVSPKLVETKYTDNDGKVVFENLKRGSYRVIAIVDRKYFEKPTYSPWNEITIDRNTTETSIEVINKIKAM